MILMDTLDTVFDEVSMDIMGLLLTKADTHDTRFAYQIFNGGDAQASNVIRDS